MSQTSFTVKSANANRAVVPDRAGQLLIQRFNWPVTAQTNGDRILLGYLPANCKIHALASQVIADGATPAFTYSLAVDVDANAIVSADAITATTFKRTAVTTYQLCETIGRPTGNVPVYLLLTAAPASAGGNLSVDLAYFDPGA